MACARTICAHGVQCIKTILTNTRSASKSSVASLVDLGFDLGHMAYFTIHDCGPEPDYAV